MQTAELKVRMGVEVRWAIRLDTTEIVDIERRSSDRPWSESEFLDAVRQRNQIAMVAVRGGRVLGYMVYKIHRESIELLRLVVDIEFRRHRVGEQLVEKLRAKLRPGRRSRIDASIRETNLGVQLFLRKQGFKATRVIRGEYENPIEDGYEFKYATSAGELVHSRNAAGI